MSEKQRSVVGGQLSVADEMHGIAEWLTVGTLREALTDLPDEMEVIMRVEGDDGGSQMMAHLVSAVPDAGCGEVEALMLDGYDNDVDGAMVHENRITSLPERQMRMERFLRS